MANNLQPTVNAEDKRKHLEFIQAIVTRLSQNSFLIKGWTITLVAALFALAAKESKQGYIIITFFPTILFWIFDGYFIYQERVFRKLYDSVRQQATTDFSLDTSFQDKGTSAWLLAIGSRTLLSFYLPIIAIISIVMFILK